MQRNHPYDDSYAARLRAFLMLFERSRHQVNDEGIVSLIPSVVETERIPHEGLNQGLYAAAKNKYFRCVRCLVHDYGAVFHKNALLSLVLYDPSYSFEDVMHVVHAAGPRGAGLDPNAMDASGRTLLHIYCDKVANLSLRGHEVNLGIVKWMVEWGVSPYVIDRTHNKQTALDILEVFSIPIERKRLEHERSEIKRIKDYLGSVSMILRPR